MRQDALVLQLVKVMNDIWLSQELDLRMIIFRCMPVGYKKGLFHCTSLITRSDGKHFSFA